MSPQIVSQISSLSNIFNVVALLLILYNIISGIIRSDKRFIAGWCVALYYCILWTWKVWGT